MFHLDRTGFRPVTRAVGPEGMMRADRARGHPCCCDAVKPVAGMPYCRRPWKPYGSQSPPHFRHRCRVRSPDPGGRSAAFEPAGGLRAHQGAGGRIRRDAVRALVLRHGLTPSGRRLLAESAQIIGAVEHLKHSAQELRGEPTGNSSSAPSSSRRCCASAISWCSPAIAIRRSSSSCRR